ncbi:Ohr family peroxiredoxin [Bradyrhizobium guangdongense]
MAASSDGHLRVKLATPGTLGDPGGEGTNPEQLFAAGYAACFLSAIRAAAAEENTMIAEDANVTATVALNKREDGPGLALRVALGVDLPGVDRGAAERFVAVAQDNCPYTHATRGNVDVRVRIA